MNLEDTIVAVSSPPGAARRGIVRLSGPDAIRIAEGLFAAEDGRRLADIAAARHAEGKLALGSERVPAAVYVFPAPRSYTRQDVVELHMLGAAGVLGHAVEACLAAGARRAEPGEFTARAFLGGAFDLSQVHAIAGIIAARSDHQLRAAEQLLHGALGNAAVTAREELADLISLVEGALDFADEPIAFIAPEALRRRLGVVHAALETTLAAGLRAERWGRLPRVVLTGPPNAGKSSLLNRLTGLDRAICAPAAGTTRDVLSAPLTIGETDCLLVDVAGFHDAISGLDARIQAARRRAVEDADLIVEVVDVAGDGGRQRIQAGVPAIVAGNKCDLVPEDRHARVREQLTRSTGAGVCLTSATTGFGCDALKAEIRRALEDRPVDIHDAAIALMAEHREALRQAVAALGRAIGLAEANGDHLEDAELVAVELREAARALGVLVGEDQTEETLGRIFSRFCIGK